MLLKKISLKNFRNYCDETICFVPGVNIIVGANGQGKSNLLEAISYLAIGKSPRSKQQDDLIRWGEKEFFLTADSICSGRSLLLESFMDKEKKILKINGVAFKRLSEYIGTLTTVSFTPDDLNLLKRGPRERRKFIDQLVAQNKPSHIALLNDYLRVLYQKGSLLRQSARYPPNDLKKHLELWNEQLLEIGGQIIKNRIFFTQKLRAKMDESFNCFFGLDSQLSVLYCSGGKTECEEILEHFSQQLRTKMGQEIEQKTALFGPHRDDILVEINRHSARYFASQGQQRALVLSLKLAEMEIIREEKGEPPLLILDDVFSELDEKRKAFLLDFIIKADQQTFVTLTSLRAFPQTLGQTFYIENGTVVYS